MKLTYDPENLAGAERYLVSEGVVPAQEARDWLEQRVVKLLSDSSPVHSGFGVAHKGLGFFADQDTITSAPAFTQSLPDQDGQDDGSMHVTYWVAADALK
ncbi:hypothetical protein [Palleronia marisminoris]|uniref:hypothetical protein n=1 Tax=Palleronia marisminoris TaxID=315423 RepID=UPI000B871F55|nr:hypothetical protein [Palleronia marisminoris]